MQKEDKDVSKDIEKQEPKPRRKPITVLDDGHVEVRSREPGAPLFGSFDDDFIKVLTVNILAIANKDTDAPQQGVSAFVASIVEGIDPRDQVEAMLATHMAATHFAIMQASRWLLHGNTDIKSVDSAERAFNKLSRTYAAQMEALKRYRSNSVSVRDVNVADGGQAIVGNVTVGKSENDKS